MDWNYAERRLIERVKQGHKQECWPCTGAPKPNGYGDIGVKNRSHYAHRLAFQVYWGVTLPSWLHVCHDCPGGDNKLCCNPAHLFVADAAGHRIDTMAKGQMPCGDRNGSRTRPDRLPRGERHGSRTHPESRPRGEKNSRAKLTELKVRDILDRCSQGEMQKAVAREYGVSPATVGLIVRGIIWAEVFNAWRFARGLQ